MTVTASSLRGVYH